MTKLGIPITPRLALALDAGDAEHLRTLLAGWSIKELAALHADMHLAYEAAVIELDSQYAATLRSNCFLPEAETVWREQRAGLLSMFTEIHEVLGFYLDQKPKGKIQ